MELLLFFAQKIKKALKIFRILRGDSATFWNECLASVRRLPSASQCWLVSELIQFRQF